MTSNHQEHILRVRFHEALQALNENQQDRAKLGQIIHDLRNLATPIMMIADFLGMEEVPVPVESLKEDLLETLNYLNNSIEDLQNCRLPAFGEKRTSKERVADAFALVDALTLPVDLRSIDSNYDTAVGTQIMAHELVQLILCVAGPHPDGSQSDERWQCGYKETDETWSLELVINNTSWPEKFIKKLSGTRLDQRDSYAPNWILAQNMIRLHNGRIEIESENGMIQLTITFKSA